MNDKKQTTPPHRKEDYIDLLEVVHTILQGKWLILFFILVASIIAFIYAYGQSPVYKADTLLRVESKKATVPGLDELAGLSSDNISVGTELELIKSRINLAQAVKKLKLDIVAQPKKMRFFSNLHKRFFSPTETKKLPPIWEKFDTFAYKYAWGNEQIIVDRLDVPKELLNKRLILVAKDNNSFEVKLGKKVLLKGKLGQSSTSKENGLSIFVSKLSGLPNTEFSITKLSMRRVIASLQNKIGASEKGKKTGIINLSLTGTNQVRIVKVLNDISANYVKQNISRSSKEASNALAFLEEQIKPLKENVDKAEASLRKYRVENKTTDLALETQGILDKVVGIDAELQKLSLSREELSLKYTNQHPTILALNAQENQLKQRKKIIQSDILKLPKKQQKRLKIERNIKVANTIYIELLNKIQEFKIAKASTVGNAYVVDVADIDESYMMPNKKRILVIGILLGGILGLVIVFLRKALRTTVISPEKLEEVTGISVYATVPLSKNVQLTTGFKSQNRRQKRLLAAQNMTDPAIESLRSLRTSLHFALHEAKNNILLITGPSPGIGKSFISSNFATVIAKTDQKVVLVDADMRKGYLHNIFELKQASGLSDIISEQASYEEAITTVKLNDISMDIITRGKTPPNPSELLMNDNFEKLLKHLSANYDLVLVDSPPVHAVTDPSIIGSHAGVVFMVVYSDRHSMQEIEHAVARLAQTGVETKGFIFNGFEAKKSGYGYGYGYGYGSYYGEK